MTEETLKQAVEIKKSLDLEREHKENLVNMVEKCLSFSDKGCFKINAYVGPFEASVYISHQAAETALYQDIENTISKIKELEAELADLH